MRGRLNWGILGAGRIAGAFAKGVAASKTGRLVAVGSRTQEKAEKFGAAHQAPHRHGSYEALLADHEVQAVYIATPHPLHAEWTIRAAEAGKHVLCEKPFSLNHAEAMAMVEAAERNGVFLMEAFMYRCHPQTAKLVGLLKENIVGEVRFVRASFGFQAKVDPRSRLFADELGGGGILDVGCYPVSMVRLIAGVVAGGGAADPTDLQGTGVLCETGVDERAAAVLRFPRGLTAVVETAVTVNLDNQVHIFGTEGEIIVPQPWVPSRDGGKTVIIVKRKDAKEPREVVIETPVPLYAWEADAVAENLAAGQAKFPAMTLADTLGNMRTLDRWRAACGLTYRKERMDAAVAPAGGRSLAVHKETNMKYGRLAGLEKPISRLVMGVDNQRTAPHAAVMFDDFIMRGGNCFDTAHIYSSGLCEKLLGKWVKERGLREQTVILDKGAHTPNCDPKSLTRQLRESLERLQTDYVDIYLLHRDNPAVPVGEFVDVLNEHVRAGRIRVFGGSNWTVARVAAADDYARAKGLQGFAAVSNQFSLARMQEVPWTGCLSSGDEDSIAWFKRTKKPLMPWSSQARGFFLPGKARPEDVSDKEMVKCFYSDDNFRRLKRVEEFAKKRGFEQIQVALAYVLCQPFPTFPLIGPRTIAETKSSCRALELELTTEELDWLDRA